MRPANPILAGLYPDPSICRVDGTYYLVNSTFEYLPGLPIHASDDLVTWRLVGHAIHDPGQFDFSAVPDSRGLFAPTIRHHDGKFYIACTLMDAGEVTGNFYVTATDIAGPWSSPVMLPDARGIDPSLFFHEGRAWWIGCREVIPQGFEGETEVWMRELDLERGMLVGVESVIWTRTMARAVWAEAPHLYERDNWFYLVTAEGGTAFEHSVMVARSRSLADPFLPCPRNPVLTHRHLGHGVEVQAVGHGDLVQGDGDDWWMVMLGIRPIDGHHILGRETHLAAVEWEDGWPVINPGLGRLDSPVERPGRWASDGVPELSDFLSVRGFPTFAEQTDSALELRSTGGSVSSGAVSAALLRRLTSTESSVAVTLELVDGQDATAGLLLRQSDSTQVRAAAVVTSDGVRVSLASRDGVNTAVGSATLPAGPFTLSAVLADGEITVSVVSGEGEPVTLGRVPSTALSTETAGGFVGTTFGPYVEGPVGARARFIRWSHDDRR